VVILGENDEKTDGSWPGKHGAEKALKAIEGVCSNPRIVFPPSEYKDVRQWVSGMGLSREAFMEHVDQYAASTSGPSPSADALADDNVSTVAGAILEQIYTADDRPTLLRCQESWYIYGAGGWTEEPSRESVRGEIHRFLARSKYRSVDGRTKNVGVNSFNPTSSYVRNVSEHLCAIVPNPSLPPAWLDEREHVCPSRLLCFANGTLGIDDFLAGDTRLTTYSSDLFVTSRLPFDYVAGASCPRWNLWLQQTLGDDPAKIALLQEWFGYNLIADNSQEKMLMMLGPTRSGKSTALSVLRNLLGNAAAASSLKSLSQDFGLHHLIGKLAAIMPDAQTPEFGRTLCLQTLLEIIGNDHVQINRKFKSALSALLTCRITIASNQLPQLPDESLALSARMMVLSFTQSFLGKEEKGLKATLRGEMSGISLWALRGLARLLENGEFTEPRDAQRMREDFANLVCPIAEFAETWVYMDANQTIPLDGLFEAWKNYAEERDTHRRTKQWLYNQLKVRFPTIDRETAVINGRTVKIVTGLGLHGFAPNARGHRS
jgi:putative DNA primase/helicase